MSEARDTKMILSSRACACGAAALGLLTLIGYATDEPLLLTFSPGLQAMSPMTAIALPVLSVAALAASLRRNRLTLLFAGIASAIAFITFLSYFVIGADAVSSAIGRRLFGAPATSVGRMSPATGVALLLISIALVARHRRVLLADLAAAGGLLISGTALLGYLYGVKDLYALPLFNSVAIHTAIALSLLAVATLFAEPDKGWAQIIGSPDAGGGATRRQLLFAAVPILAGWALLSAVNAGLLGPSVAMAILVIATIVPLAALILRDGRVLTELDRERRAAAQAQECVAGEMRERLAEQATELEHESEERARVEAVMYRAQRMEAVGQLTGGIAHDFNNLLMAIRGNLELLGGRLVSHEDKLKRYVANAIIATDKGAKITAQLLAFSRSQRLAIRSVELKPVLVSARELIGNALGPDIRLEMAIEAADTWVDTDSVQLELAILNLAVNARDAMPEGGRLRIESRPCRERLAEEADDTDYVSIRIIDEGIGMSADVLSQAVEPFFTTKALGKGTGLGLAQVYGFVRQCGGDLRITSTPGEGTQVEILLRCVSPGPAETDAVKAVTTTSIAVGGETVLVIDDDDGVRAIIVEALRGAGFDVEEASSGASGLALLERISPVAAVIDFLMPDMNGAEVARIAQLRQPGLPIVFVSGYSDTVALDGIAGAVVLRKPFDIAGLNRAVASVLH